MEIAAFFQGILGASSLFLGASVGVFWRPNKAFSAAIMAFGSGILLAVLAFEITDEVYQESGFLPLVSGFFLGGLLFIGLTEYVDRHGGFLRQPAPSRRYLLEQTQEQASDVLKRIAHIDVIQNLPDAEQRILASLLKPIHVAPQDIICQEGETGDYFYLIVKGEAEVCKRDRVVAILRAGETFGEMSLLTGEPRSASVKAVSPMDLYQISKEGFEWLLNRSPHLARAISRTLARRLQVSTESQVESERNLSLWQQQLMNSVQLDLMLRQDSQTLAGLIKRSAPSAILIGTLIDNIPEAVVIGMNVGKSYIGWSFLLAVFISNFPEALSSAAGMKQTGTKNKQILSLWIGVVLLSGVCAVAGYLLQNQASEFFLVLAHSMAGGAILSMLASTMMPEAYELGGSTVAFSTISGFLSGFFVTTIQLN